MSAVTILLVDDHPIVREGYHRLLERQEEFHVCAEAGDAQEAYRAYKEHRPNVVVMDLALPGASGIEGVRHIRQWDKDAKILVFTMHLGVAFALKAFEAGASGYVTKSSAPGELVRAVKAVAAGGRFLSEDVSRAIAADRLAGPERVIDQLGPRETEILRLLASGLTSEAIAEMLNLSTKTVRNHHYAIKGKIGAQNDAHLVWLAVSAGLVKIDDASFDGHSS
ncbi:response regulator transcription factor [Hyphomicrobium sp.]|uniref:response regulator n=1 Tax=Hyphomicrobium sp. TaxID=82 RepID=UPI000FBEFE1A|nr:response regulator transcription factor [Hyphomicrobium sp.]MBN9247141.1 response regulator transcription factor [Hyphomicrobium sp.]RUP07709.1 MAG: response regulator transcription factor [Hyphomicrobium sp.]